MTALTHISKASATTALLDARQRVLRDVRISLTDRCNLRCTYCMPQQAFGADHRFLPSSQVLDFDEIVSLARILAGLGVRKIKLTGGEPLARPGVPALVRMLKAAVPDVEVKLITNGVLLAPLADSLREAGLDRLTISLDTLKPDRFAGISGRAGKLDDVLAGIEAARAAGFRPLKINTVVIRGSNDDEIEDIAARFRRPDTVLRFIEYMDVGTVNGWRPQDVVTAAEILARLQWTCELVPVEAAYRGETARRYRYADGSGEIGFIASISQPFCGDCNRLRLSADGKLYTCLFAKHGFDIREVLRSGGADEAQRAIADLWRGRQDQYSVLRATSRTDQKIEMFYIGG
jgi:cyclic pyranopterin phosphate synthase